MHKLQKGLGLVAQFKTPRFHPGVTFYPYFRLSCTFLFKTKYFFNFITFTVPSLLLSHHLVKIISKIGMLACFPLCNSNLETTGTGNVAFCVSDRFLINRFTS